MSQQATATAVRIWLTIGIQKCSNDGAAVDLAEIAEMIECEAREASLSAVQVEQVALLIRLSDDAAARERDYWERRARRMGAAVLTIRRLVTAAA